MDYRGRKLSEIGSGLNSFARLSQAGGLAIPHEFSAPVHRAKPAGSLSSAAPNRTFTPARRGRRRRIMGAVAVSTLAVFGLWSGVSASLSAGLLDADRIASTLGFGIEQVSLTGHANTIDRDLFEALDLTTAKSLLSFDAAAVRQRFEKLPWVQSAEISRIWPNQIAIHVEERSAAALWRDGETAFLIDEAGGVLGPVSPSANINLPRVSGPGARLHAAALWGTLGRHPSIKSRVREAEWVGNRRWTLHMTDGATIHLPANGEASALIRLGAHSSLASPIGRGPLIVDLRSPDRISLRSAGGERSLP